MALTRLFCSNVVNQLMTFKSILIFILFLLRNISVMDNDWIRRSQDYIDTCMTFDIGEYKRYLHYSFEHQKIFFLCVQSSSLVFELLEFYSPLLLSVLELLVSLSV